LTLNEAKSNHMQRPVATTQNVSSSSAWNFLLAPLLGIIKVRHRDDLLKKINKLRLPKVCGKNIEFLELWFSHK